MQKVLAIKFSQSNDNICKQGNYKNNCQFTKNEKTLKNKAFFLPKPTTNPHLRQKPQ
jgi:hypothetical protein